MNLSLRAAERKTEKQIVEDSGNLVKNECTRM